MIREDVSRARCGHTPCVVMRTQDGQAFYGRCLVCGKIGPLMPSSEEARQALLPDLKEGRGEN